MYVSRDQKDWDTHLSAVLFGYRVSPHDTTGESPFYLLYGREPRLPVDVSLLPKSNQSNSVEEHRAHSALLRNVRPYTLSYEPVTIGPHRSPCMLTG